MKGHFAALLGGLAAAGAVAYGFERRRGAARERADEGAQENRARGVREEDVRRRRSVETRGERRPPMRPVGIVDLNTASADDLSAMGGIGREDAERIIENRPYRNKLDLVSRMVLQQDAYDAIKHSVSVDGAEDAVKVA